MTNDSITKFIYKMLISCLAVVVALSIALPSLSQISQSNNSQFAKISNTAYADDDDDDDSDEGKGKDDSEESKENKDAANEGRFGGNPKNKMEHYDGDSRKGMWVLYAQIIMVDSLKTLKDQDEKKNDNGMFFSGSKKEAKNIIGDGGVEFPIAYNEMSKYSHVIGQSETEGGDSGQALASFFSTMNEYNYIDTYSGQRLAASGSQGLNNLGRGLGGLVAIFGLTFYAATSKIFGWIVDAFAAINPYRLFGFGDKAEADKDNPFSVAVYDFFDKIGIDGTLMNNLIQMGLVIILLIFGFKIMASFARADMKGAGGQVVKFFIRIFIMFAMFPIMALVANDVMQTTDKLMTDTKTNSAVPTKYLLDNGDWSTSQNFAPAGLNSTDKPPDASAADNHVDDKYKPHLEASRERIENINDVSRKAMFTEGDSESDKDKYASRLVHKWMSGDMIDVNSYVSSMRRSSSQTGDTLTKSGTFVGVDNFENMYAKNKKSEREKEGGKPNKTALKSYMWSANPNVDDKTKLPSHEHFNPSNLLGVHAHEGDGIRNSFSTQSVVLMLQSGVDNTGTTFYASNIPPSGLQGMMKNVSTVKTKWLEVTLPGESSVGVFGSWLKMVVESLSYAIVTLAVILAIVTGNLFLAMIKFIIHTIRGIVRGSMNSAFATFMLFLGIIGTLVIGTALPSILLSVIDKLSDAIGNELQSSMATMFYDLIVAMITLFIVVYVSFMGKVAGGDSPVRMLVQLPIKMALSFESRVAELDRAGDLNIGRTFEGMGRSTAGVANEEFGKTGQGISRDFGIAKGTTGGSAKGLMSGAAKGAALGLATGGTGAVAAGLAKGAGRGLASGAREGMQRGKSANGQGVNLSGISRSSASNVKQAHDADTAKKAQRQKAKQNEQAVYDNKGGSNGSMYNNDAQSGNSRQSMARKDYYSNPKQAADSASELNSKDLKKADTANRENGLKGSQSLVVPSSAIGGSKKDSLRGADSMKSIEEMDSTNTNPALYAQEASQTAREALREDGTPMFSEDEHNRLSKAQSEDEFVNELKNTEHGTEYAMDTESAKEALQDSEFVDEEGNIKQDYVKEFEESYDDKQANGNLTKDDYAQKAKLDTAFAMGAKEHFRDARSKYHNQDNNSNDNNSGGQTSNGAVKADGTVPVDDNYGRRTEVVNDTQSGQSSARPRQSTVSSSGAMNPSAKSTMGATSDKFNRSTSGAVSKASSSVKKPSARMAQSSQPLNSQPSGSKTTNTRKRQVSQSGMNTSSKSAMSQNRQAQQQSQTRNQQREQQQRQREQQRQQQQKQREQARTEQQRQANRQAEQQARSQQISNRNNVKNQDSIRNDIDE